MLHIEEINKRIKEPDYEAMLHAKKHWDNIAKPLNGLGLMEELIIKIAGIQRRDDVQIRNKAIVIMCSDNGVVEEGVTQTDSSVTAIVTENFAKGIASVNRMAAIAGARVIPVDIGVAADLKEPGILLKKIAYGTKNLAKEPAMTREQAWRAITTGIELVGSLKEEGIQIIGTGEMGIGNTTSSSAIASVLLGLKVEQMTGKGAGLSEEGIKRKIETIKKGIYINKPQAKDAIDVLSKLGGYDIAGITGLFLGGAIYGIPTVIDGLISAVGALLAVRICKRSSCYMLPSHMSNEPSCEAIMNELELSPVIHAKLALGEGTGTALLFPMLDMAFEVYKENSTFEDIQIKAYEKFEETGDLKC